MTLIKTSILNAIAVLVKMLTLLGINKVLAIYVGPSGYAALGQFQNAMTMITTFASGAINTGVTKYTAEHQANEDKQQLVWRTAGTIALIGSLFTACLIAIFNKNLALYFLKDENFGGVFIWFGATLILFTFNALLLAILNGKKEIKKYVFANIAGSVLSLVVTTLMVVFFGLYGALVALAVFQSISFFVTFFICYKAPWFEIKYMLGGADRETAINLGRFTAMALTSALCVPVSHIMVRNHLGESFGWDAAGYWEAMWRISSAYLIFVTTTLSVYYVPRLSELHNTAAIKKEIIQGYKVILPIAATFGVSIYILRDIIISILLTDEFKSMRQLFAWQIIGDTLKIGSWIIAYFILSKAMVKVFITTEVIFSLTFVLLTQFLTAEIGLQGVAVAHAVNYAIYWVVMISIFINKLKLTSIDHDVT